MNTDTRSTMMSILQKNNLSLLDISILYNMAMGYTTEQIASMLHLSPDAIKSRRKILMRRFHAINAPNLIYKTRVLILAYEIYLFNPPSK